MDPSRQLHVAVIDDNPHARTITRMILQAIGAEVQEFADGRSALKGLQRWRADVAIVDYEMGPVNGVQFTRILREREALEARYTAVIMATGHGDRTHVAEAKAAGVDGFLLKPLTTGALLSRLRRALVAAAQPRTFVLSA